MAGLKDQTVKWLNIQYTSILGPVLPSLPWYCLQVWKEDNLSCDYQTFASLQQLDVFFWSKLVFALFRYRVRRFFCNVFDNYLASYSFIVTIASIVCTYSRLLWWGLPPRRRRGGGRGRWRPRPGLPRSTGTPYVWEPARVWSWWNSIIGVLDN